MKAWHFAQENRRLGYNDGRLIRKGQWLVHRGPLVMCESGLHASKRIIDALKYASGSVICRVELGGEIVHGEDKSVAERRQCLWYIDGTDLLRKFARMCALDVIHLWDAPDIVIQYLRSGDETIRAAARAAARATAGATARATAWAAAGAAAEAAGAAAWAAARATAWATARATARAKRDRRLLRLVSTEAKRLGILIARSDR